jgi:hypothetical protein
MALTVQIELMIAEEIITGFYRIRDFIKSKRVKYLNEKNHQVQDQATEEQELSGDSGFG